MAKPKMLIEDPEEWRQRVADAHEELKPINAAIRGEFARRLSFALAYQKATTGQTIKEVCLQAEVRENWVRKLACNGASHTRGKEAELRSLAICVGACQTNDDYEHFFIYQSYEWFFGKDFTVREPLWEGDKTIEIPEVAKEYQSYVNSWFTTSLKQYMLQVKRSRKPKPVAAKPRSKPEKVQPVDDKIIFDKVLDYIDNRRDTKLGENQKDSIRKYLAQEIGELKHLDDNDKIANGLIDHLANKFGWSPEPDE